MSQEIVQRLHGAAEYRREFGPVEAADIFVQAADEIEVLRAELADVKDDRSGLFREASLGHREAMDSILTLQAHVRMLEEELRIAAQQLYSVGLTYQGGRAMNVVGEPVTH